MFLVQVHKFDVILQRKCFSNNFSVRQFLERQLSDRSNRNDGQSQSYDGYEEMTIPGAK